MAGPEFIYKVVYVAVEPLAANKKLAFTVEVPPDLPRGRRKVQEKILLIIAALVIAWGPTRERLLRARAFIRQFLERWRGRTANAVPDDARINGGAVGARHKAAECGKHITLRWKRVSSSMSNTTILDHHQLAFGKRAPSLTRERNACQQCDRLTLGAPLDFHTCLGSA
jgi:hypothetical protein